MLPETVLVAHNRYLERGGEDGVFEAETRLLEHSGHRVIRYERDNREIAEMNGAVLAARTVWSARDHRELGELVRRERVALVHFHNTFPLISPAAHHAARAAGAAVVQTLHNFRLLCPAGTFLRAGAPCEQCLGRTPPWPAVVHRCYRGSAAASAVISGMLTVHRVLRTWQTQVDAFIALSRFARERFVRGGIPEDRLHVSAGFVEDAPTPAGEGGEHFLFVGRLSEEKGVRVLLDAWHRLQLDSTLRIIGHGPLAPLVAEAVRHDPRVQWLGARPRAEVLAEMRQAYALVFPSICYENFPGVLAEAQAAGLPAVASRLGSAPEIVTDGESGLLFEAGNAASLAETVQRLASQRASRAEYARRARDHFDRALTPEHAYARLTGIYRSALERRHAAN